MRVPQESVSTWRSGSHVQRLFLRGLPCQEPPYGGSSEGPATCNALGSGQSQNTVPIASTQVAIKGIVQYSTMTQFVVEQLATRHSREHMLSAVGPDAQVE